MSNKMKKQLLAVAAILGLTTVVLADEVIMDDIIAMGSMCIGGDCVNGEGFDFTTLRLKENNLRIHFQDTSSSASFPRRDWEIVINDSSNGGGEYFAVYDRDAQNTPFKVEGRAPQDALVVGASGNLGLKTPVPLLDVHVASGNTPAMRFEQDGSGGFAQQTWDVGGNEANFFVRDATGDGALPLKIRPGAPDGSLDVSASGDLGLGTAAPAGFVHVYRDEGAGSDPATGAGLRIETHPASPAESVGIAISNEGPVLNAYTDEDSGVTWLVRAGASGYEVLEASAGTTAMTLSANGNMVIGGVLSEGSSRTIKHRIEGVDAAEVLQRVSELDVKRWRYKQDPSQSEHIGPMAEDFHAAFGVGVDDRHLASIDASGVALASIRALNEKLEQQNAELRRNNAALEARLQALERAVSRLGN